MKAKGDSEEASLHQHPRHSNSVAPIEISTPRRSTAKIDKPQDKDEFDKKTDRAQKISSCGACHISYKRHESPFPMSLNRCEKCKKKVGPILI